MTAEHGVRPGDVTGVGASRARALLTLDHGEAPGSSLGIKHGE